MDAPPPRLTTLREERKAKRFRDELNGVRGAVTLPKVSFLGLPDPLEKRVRPS